jgi:pimeloyl-ACP methyl ester carboxylesterase
VHITVSPEINIEVWLPTTTWNGRYRGEGGSYYAGFISYYSMIEGLQKGYATASTDTGHRYTPSELTNRANFGTVVGAFGLNSDRSLNYQLIRDFSFRSQHELVLKAKSVIKAFYGSNPRYSYWNGCSSGGREGLAAVQRFPDEYDGVLAQCPAINWDRFMPAGLWARTVMQQELGHPIEPAKLEAVASAAISACDSDDGVSDGIINDPRKCRYDPSTMICTNAVAKDGDSRDVCLSHQEALAIRKIWEGPKSVSTGERVWFGLEKGASFKLLTGDDWLGDYPHGVAHFQWIRQTPDFSWRMLTEADYERDLRISQERFGEVIATDQADLSGFRSRGGKVLIIHGERDEIISPRGTLNYFQRVLTANGGEKEVGKFARLFMIPGAGHICSGDDQQPFPADPFGSLVDWVEKGNTPDQLAGSQKLPNGQLRTRPLCAYPKTAKWSGKGSPDDSANFGCVDGQHDKRDFVVSTPDIR